MKRFKIKELNPTLIGSQVLVKGWIRTVRVQKICAFLELNDGSTLTSLQVVLGPSLLQQTELMEQLTTGASCAIIGNLVASPAAKQTVELEAHSCELLGSSAPGSYPLQKKRHSFEFLRSLAHLRPRTNTMGAVARIRNTLAYATHRFFQEKGFLYVQTPIITSSDCEGGGQLFQLVTTQPEGSQHDTEFFGKKAYLTVSGQLNAECYACALSDVYTFGPTFRAENSHTSRHLAEFWMVEPEMAFADLQEDMQLAELYLKKVCQDLLEANHEDLAFFDRYVAPGSLERVQQLVERSFERISYSEAIEILIRSGRSFGFPVTWGADLQSEHERYLCEEHFKGPLIVYDYPAALKAFYMRANDDGKTVAAMDILLPIVGEIVGGSQREERYERLLEKIVQAHLDPADYRWYLELRQYGSVPHAGFGAGFERLVQFVTGIENIRETIPFPRAPGQIAF